MRFAAKSEQGKRLQNEDRLFIPTRPGDVPLAVVADGMGGHNAGSTASTLAVEVVVEALRKGGLEPIENRILSALEAANGAVYQHALENPNCRGMGTTMVLALAFKNKYVAANVGDSRLYFFDGQQLTQISQDHSYVAQLVAAGQITPEQAIHHPRRNIITRALGTRQAEQADLFRGEWKPGDMLMLCSDGLYGVMDDRDMARILREEPDLDAACDQLVRDALYGGTTDNVSVVLIRNEEGK